MKKLYHERHTNIIYRWYILLYALFANWKSVSIMELYYFYASFIKNYIAVQLINVFSILWKIFVYSCSNSFITVWHIRMFIKLLFIQNGSQNVIFIISIIIVNISVVLLNDTYLLYIWHVCLVHVVNKNYRVWQ